MVTKRAVKPLKQGELDGLCGVYSIINAAKYLFPRDQIDLEDLFAFILTKIDERKLAEKAKVLKFLKTSFSHKISIEDTEALYTFVLS